MVKPLDSSRDFCLGRAEINPENESVLVFDLAARLVRGNWALDDLVVVSLEGNWLHGLVIVNWLLWSRSRDLSAKLDNVPDLLDLLLLASLDVLSGGVSLSRHQKDGPNRRNRLVVDEVYNSLRHWRAARSSALCEADLACSVFWKDSNIWPRAPSSAPLTYWVILPMVAFHASKKTGG